ncbi:hypothetical protein [Streptomyces sp. enrichment culture]|uniref:hypothetical protein n=1 Tax=Streptomyces sp. enrichment culture TaxID=1795815 RepID=UPI003F5448B3
MTVWGAVVTATGSVLALIGVVFTARATSRAAQATARANEAAARAQAEPNQRAEDRAAFEAIKTELRTELTATREEVRGLRSLVRSFAWYVGELTSQMRRNGIEPPSPPARVDEYNRTGV